MRNHRLKLGKWIWIVLGLMASLSLLNLFLNVFDIVVVH